MSFDLSRPGEPEYLSDSGSGDTPARSRRRLPVLALAAAGVVGVVAAGGWAAMSLMTDDAQPASALPASALAYLSVDLDPHAAQKIEALEMVGKFPALDKELGLDATDDLRRWVFDNSHLAKCDGLTYEDDVEPWIGERAAVAVLPPKDKGAEPTPVVALAVTDEDEAGAALEALTACAPKRHPAGFALTGGYAVLAETTELAEAAVAEAEAGTLADDAGFQEWTTAAGDPGVVTMYVAAQAPVRLMGLGRDLSGQDDWLSDAPPGLAPDELPMDKAQIKQLAADFRGMAAIVRFRDGALETEFAAGGVPGASELAEGATTGIADLPASTGAAFSVALSDGWLDEYLTSLGTMTGMPVKELVAEAEAQSGLDLPADVEALLGDNVSVAVDASLDAGVLMHNGDPTAVPAGVKVTGDPDEILAVMEKVRAKLGPAADMLVVSEGDGVVAFGLSQKYVDELASAGGLGDDLGFQAAVPDADKASSVAYLNFDAGNSWVEGLVEDLAAGFTGGVGGGHDPMPQVRENMSHLEAIGVSSWVEDGVQRGVFRLTTD